MISIIVPAFNSAPWIASTIESVIAQTHKDWEMIIVEDGSTDSTIEIVSDYVEKDSRIRLIQSCHGGVAECRKIGLKEARGNIIAFIDSDDLWPAFSLGYLLSLKKLHNADMVCGSYLKFKDGQQEKAFSKCYDFYREKDRLKTELLSGQAAAEKSMYQIRMHSSLWANLFDKDLFDLSLIKPGEIYEDLNIFYRLCLNANRVIVTECPVYLYRQRTGSILHTFNRSRLDVLTVTERMENYVRLNAPELIPAARDRRFSANFNMLILISRYLKKRREDSEEEDFFIKKMEEIITYLQQTAPDELNNKNIRFKNRMGARLVRMMPQRFRKS